VVSTNNSPVDLSKAENFLSKLVGGDEEEPAAGNRSARHNPFCVLDAHNGKLWKFAKINLPQVFAGIEIDAFKVPQGGAMADSRRVQDIFVTGKSILHSRKLGACAAEFFPLTIAQEIDSEISCTPDKFGNPGILPLQILLWR